MNQVRALLAFLCSFYKPRWTLRDYPIRVLHRAPDPAFPSPRFTFHPWTAQIVNWWHMRGDGLTRADAFAELEAKFAEYERRHALPRPGRVVALRLKVLPAIEVSRLRPIVDEILRAVLKVDPNDCMVTDGSSLWNFHVDESNDEYFRRIEILYGVSVRDLDPPTIVAIAQRIAESRASTPGE